MRRWAIAIVSGVALAGPAPAAALEPGGTEFWRGGDSCGAACWEHPLDVAAGGHRLRVALDRPVLGGDWRVELRDGGGAPAAGAVVPQHLYSGEAFADAPAAGRWTVRVTAAGVADPRFRMRAKLERSPVAPPQPVAELPNLQALPPWDLTFAFPITNGSGGGPSQGVLLPGGRAGCHAEEVQQERALRCLRMAFGVRNTGRGPMDLLLGPGVEPQDRSLTQRIHFSDGSTSDRAAGTAWFHPSHGHYHQADAVELELLRLEAGGSLAAAAPPRRKGFAHANELLREWTMFHPTWRLDGFGLLAGWGDYYEWDRPGNFADFGLNPDGRYVLRLTVDPGASVAETNEHDNVGYSVIDVAGERVTLLESGRGSGPGDRCRILVPLGPEPDLPAAAAQPPRPADCPADTVDPDPPPLVAAPRPAAPQPPRPAAKRPAKRCPKLRRGMSRRRKAAVKRCRRAAAKRRAQRHG